MRYLFPSPPPPLPAAPAARPQPGRWLLLLLTLLLLASSLPGRAGSNPQIFSLSPNSGPVGTQITISGQFLDDGPTVTFNGVQASGVVIVSSNSLKVNVPVGATTGNVIVTSSFGGQSNPVLFTVGSPLTLTSLSPARNARSAARATDVALTFDQALNPATADNVRVFSSQRGGQLVRGGNATASGSTLTVNPANDLRPGETVRVSVPATVQSSAGTAAVKSVYQFTAAAGTGPGTFGDATSVSVGNDPQALAVGDVNGDGFVDLLTANAGANNVSVRLNNGTGTFGGTTNVPVGTRPQALALGDVDGDGDLDIFATNLSSGTVSVRLNDGTGTFGGTTNVPVAANPSNLAVGDVDGDGDLDFVTYGINALSVRLNDGAGSFSGTGSTFTGSVSFNIELGDVDGDGDLDLLATLRNDNQVAVYRNDGTGSFGAATTLAISNGPESLAVADVDGDGALDLLVGKSNGSSSTVSLRLNDGTGTFSGSTEVPVDAPTYGLAVADVDGDGDLDILANTTASGFVRVRLNDGTGTFSGTFAMGTGNFSGDMATADVDGDGDIDVLTINPNVATVSVYLNRVLPPRVQSLSVTSGLVGTSLTLTGTSFTGATSVTFNGTPATTFAVVSASSITVTVPAGATTGSVVVTTPAGSDPFPPQFTVLINLTVNTGTAASPVVIAAGEYNNITVTGSGFARLSDRSQVQAVGSVVVESGGSLDTNCGRLSGNGSFTLQAGATLLICDANGIGASGSRSGPVRLTGPLSFSPDANYVYNGTAAQNTGTGLPAQVRNLEAANANGLTLTQPVAVANVLRLTSGTFATAGQLTLLSTATRTAYAVHNGGLTSGNVTVQRYIGGPAAAGYRHLSSPVQSTTVADLTTAGYTPVVNPAANNLPYVAPPAASFPNIFGYDETRGGVTPAYAGFATGYFSPATLADGLISGRGYSVFMPGAKTPDFVGALTTGNLPVTLTVTGTNTSPNTQKAGWHLLGNRYPQPIDWDLATVPAGMSSSISVFRTQGGNNGIYLTRANGVGNLPNGEIAVGQAFFARATANNTVFTFTNALRVESNPATVARPVADTRPTVRLTLQSTAPDAAADETVIYAETGATTGEDNRFDGLRPGRNTGNVPTLASVIAGQEAAVNGLPLESLTAGNTIVELTAALPVVGTYTLTAADVANLPAGTTVSILDRKLNVTQPLTAGTAYQLTASAAGEVVAGRFALVFNANRVLSAGGVIATPRALQVYPNPASAQNGVQVAGAIVGTQLTLFDALGRAVAQATADAAGATSLPLRGLATGVYILRTLDGRTARLVVE